jgi:hypothetical protein
MRTLIILISFTVAAFADLSQSLPSPDDPAANTRVGSASFTDPARYNSYDFYGSPLGLFEKEHAYIKVDAGSRYIRWHEKTSDDSLNLTGSVLNIPRILIGSPKTVYMQLFYAPSAMVWPAPLPNYPLNLDVKRFGVTIVGQVPSGLFQLAFRGNGYIGNESKKAFAAPASTRMLMGLDVLTVSVGTRIKESVSIGIEGGARARLDTLVNNSAPALHDRYFEGQIPVIGGFINFKRDDLPIASAFSVSTGTSRFIYVTGLSEDQDPIKGDSLAWKWQAVGNISGEKITFHPALFMGYLRNNYQSYMPSATNDNLNVGEARLGAGWKISDFCFGMGTSMEAAKYITSWFEYSHSSLGLVYGNAWPASVDKNAGFHRFCLGVEAALHAIPALRFPSSIETKASIDFFNMVENNVTNPFHSEVFGLGNNVVPGSKMYRYNPESYWGSNQRIIGTTLGLGATFFNRMFSVQSDIAFLFRGSNTSGYEFAINCGYCFK